MLRLVFKMEWKVRERGVGGADLSGGKVGWGGGVGVVREAVSRKELH